MAAKHSKINQGFTLLEMLIALSISLMLILSISFSYRQLAFTLQKTSHQLDVNNQKIIVIKFLNERLSHIKYPANVNLNFFGDITKVTFISDPVTSALINSTIKYSIYLDSDAKNIMVDTFDMDNNLIDSVILLESVEHFKLNYFGTPGPEFTEKQWHNQWNNNQQPPLLIKISIAQLNQEIWPDIYIANKLTPDYQLTVNPEQ